MKTKLNPVSLKNNVVVQALATETLVYDLGRNKAFCLNQTSAMVWQLCDGERNSAEIAQLMSSDLKIPVSEDYVWLAISDLQKEDLIEVGTSQPLFEGKSRREVIRKIGFASMIALLVISSLVAPRAVDAQSGCSLSAQTCVFDTFRQSNCCSNLRCSDTNLCGACLTNLAFYVNTPTPNQPACTLLCEGPRFNLCCNTGGYSQAYNSNGLCICACF